MEKYDFRGKSCILDTNILSAMMKGQGSDRFRPVFEFLRTNDVIPFVIEATKFEFVGYSGNKKSYESLKEWLSPFLVDFIKAEDFALATRLSAMYKCKNPSISPKQISFVDCLHAALLCRYKERAFLVTTDLNDYPSFLFDMAHCEPIEDEGGATFFVAFKVFSQAKWDDLEKTFARSG